MTYLSTGQCSKITGLSQMTIIRAIDKGLIESFCVPGSKHRRVTKESLLKYIEAYKIPVTKDDIKMLTE